MSKCGIDDLSLTDWIKIGIKNGWLTEQEFKTLATNRKGLWQDGKQRT
jgi:hypothetical protein